MKQTGLFILIIFCSVIWANAKECSVKGRVVDDSGQPVPEAEIYFGGEYRDDVDSIIVINAPDQFGLFDLKRVCANEAFDLLITSKIDYKNSLVPLDPSFLMAQGKNKTFSNYAGIKLEKDQTDVGDIRIQTVFQKMRINFQTETGENLFDDFEKAQNAKFIVKNQNGKIAGYAYPTKREAFDNSSISISLPEGKWFIEIKTKKNKSRTVYAGKPIEISRTGPNNREINLKMSPQKNKF